MADNPDEKCGKCGRFDPGGEARNVGGGKDFDGVTLVGFVHSCRECLVKYRRKKSNLTTSRPR